MRKAVLVWDCRGDSAAEAVERLKRLRWLPSFARRLKRRRAERERASAGARVRPRRLRQRAACAALRPTSVGQTGCGDPVRRVGGSFLL